MTSLVLPPRERTPTIWSGPACRTAHEPMPMIEPTPMMEQYLALRAQVPTDAVLFYRAGGFYELVFKDAERVAKTLGEAVIRLDAYGGPPIATLAIPVHSSEAFLARLVEAGIAVAVAEEVETRESASRRGSMVARDILRLCRPDRCARGAGAGQGRAFWANCTRNAQCLQTLRQKP